MYILLGWGRGALDWAALSNIEQLVKICQDWSSGIAGIAGFAGFAGFAGIAGIAEAFLL